MQLVGFLGYYNKVNEGIGEVVQLLKNINVNTWLVSGDPQALHCRIAAYRAGMIDLKVDKLLRITGVNYQDISLELNLILQEINFHHRKT